MRDQSHPPQNKPDNELPRPMAADGSVITAATPPPGPPDRRSANSSRAARSRPTSVQSILSSVGGGSSGLPGTAATKQHKLKARFNVIKKLGKGTYGKVQLAVNKQTGQEVAIKTIKKSKIDNEQDLERVRREIQIMSSIEHPHIVHIYEVFENKDKIVLVMQYAPGGELYEYVSQSNALSDNEARRLFRQIATAIYYCHENKICHRDLKLENILLDEKNNAKIADFGLSNVFDSHRQLKTFCGSPLYASPEIVLGSPYEGPEVDCWSLGVLLYTLVYGAMPFEGTNFKRLVKQISEASYVEPKQKSAASPLIRRLLCADPSHRANILDICTDTWVNGTGCVGSSDLPRAPLLKVAQDMASLTPVRLDMLEELRNPPVDTKMRVPLDNLNLQPKAKDDESQRAGSPVASYVVRDLDLSPIKPHVPSALAATSNQTSAYEQAMDMENNNCETKAPNNSQPQTESEMQQSEMMSLETKIQNSEELQQDETKIRKSRKSSTETPQEPQPMDIVEEQPKAVVNQQEQVKDTEIQAETTDSGCGQEVSDIQMIENHAHVVKLDEPEPELSDREVSSKVTDEKQSDIPGSQTIEDSESLKKTDIEHQVTPLAEPAKDVESTIAAPTEINQRRQSTVKEQIAVSSISHETVVAEEIKVGAEPNPGETITPAPAEESVTTTATTDKPKKMKKRIVVVKKKKVKPKEGVLTAEEPKVSAPELNTEPDKQPAGPGKLRIPSTFQEPVAAATVSQPTGPSKPLGETAPRRQSTLVADVSQKLLMQSVQQVSPTGSCAAIKSDQAQLAKVSVAEVRGEFERRASCTPTPVATERVRSEACPEEANVESVCTIEPIPVVELTTDCQIQEAIEMQLEACTQKLTSDLEHLSAPEAADIVGGRSDSAETIRASPVIPSAPAPIARSYKKVTFTADGARVTETGRIYASRDTDGTVRRVERKSKVTHYPSQLGEHNDDDDHDEQNSDLANDNLIEEEGLDPLWLRFESGTSLRARRPFEHLVTSGEREPASLDWSEPMFGRRLSRADSASSSCSSNSTDVFDDIFDTWTGAGGLLEGNMRAMDELHGSLMKRALGSLGQPLHHRRRRHNSRGDRARQQQQRPSSGLWSPFSNQGYESDSGPRDLWSSRGEPRAVSALGSARGAIFGSSNLFGGASSSTARSTLGDTETPSGAQPRTLRQRLSEHTRNRSSRSNWMGSTPSLWQTPADSGAGWLRHPVQTTPANVAPFPRPPTGSPTMDVSSGFMDNSSSSLRPVNLQDVAFGRKTTMMQLDHNQLPPRSASRNSNSGATVGGPQQSIIGAQPLIKQASLIGLKRTSSSSTSAGQAATERVFHSRLVCASPSLSRANAPAVGAVLPGLANLSNSRVHSWLQESASELTSSSSDTCSKVSSMSEVGSMGAAGTQTSRVSSVAGVSGPGGSISPARAKALEQLAWARAHYDLEQTPASWLAGSRTAAKSMTTTTTTTTRTVATAGASGAGSPGLGSSPDERMEQTWTRTTRLQSAQVPTDSGKLSSSRRSLTQDDVDLNNVINNNINMNDTPEDNDLDLTSASLLEQLRARGYRSMINQRMGGVSPGERAAGSPSPLGSVEAASRTICATTRTTTTTTSGNIGQSDNKNNPTDDGHTDAQIDLHQTTLDPTASGVFSETLLSQQNSTSLSQSLSLAGSTLVEVTTTSIPKSPTDGLQGLTVVHNEQVEGSVGQIGISTDDTQETILLNANPDDEDDEDDEDFRLAKASVRSYLDRAKQTDSFIKEMRLEEQASQERQRQQLFLTNSLMLSSGRFSGASAPVRVETEPGWMWPASELKTFGNGDLHSDHVPPTTDYSSFSVNSAAGFSLGKTDYLSRPTSVSRPVSMSGASLMGRPRPRTLRLDLGVEPTELINSFGCNQNRSRRPLSAHLESTSNFTATNPPSYGRRGSSQLRGNSSVLSDAWYSSKRSPMVSEYRSAFGPQDSESRPEEHSRTITDIKARGTEVEHIKHAPVRSQKSLPANTDKWEEPDDSMASYRVSHYVPRLGGSRVELSEAASSAPVGRSGRSLQRRADSARSPSACHWRDSSSLATTLDQTAERTSPVSRRHSLTGANQQQQTSTATSTTSLTLEPNSRLSELEQRIQQNKRRREQLLSGTRSPLGIRTQDDAPGVQSTTLLASSASVSNNQDDIEAAALLAPPVASSSTRDHRSSSRSRGSSPVGLSSPGRSKFARPSRLESMEARIRRKSYCVRVGDCSPERRPSQVSLEKWRPSARTYSSPRNSLVSIDSIAASLQVAAGSNKANDSLAGE